MKLNRDFMAKAAGLERLDVNRGDQLDRYTDLLIAANSKINLVSRSVDLEREIESQVAISLLLLRVAPAGAATWIDIGSGGGFPVIPLACLRDDIQFTAVEQVAKKAFFLERTTQELGLKNLKIEPTSIESIIFKNSSSRWTVVSLKAVTDLDQSIRWAAKLLIDNGTMLTYKPEAIDPDGEEMLEKHGLELVSSITVKELIDTIGIRIVMYKKS